MIHLLKEKQFTLNSETFLLQNLIYHSAFKNNGYTYEGYLNIIVNLDKSEEELWNEVHSKRRNEIRRAKKEGTLVEIADSIETIEETHCILKEVYSRAKLPLPSIDYFKQFFRDWVLIYSGCLSQKTGIGLLEQCAHFVTRLKFMTGLRAHILNSIKFTPMI